MAGGHYVLLAWASLTLVPWLAIYRTRPALRRALWWSSWFAVPFGLSEVMFAGRYWSPPSLFDLAARVHLDLESFVFLFAAGGLAGVAYNAITGRPIGVPRAADPAPPVPIRNAAFASPAVAFALALLVLHAPIFAAVIAMAVGACSRALVRPELAKKIVTGGALFAAYYALLVGSLVACEPGYVATVWNTHGPAGTRVAGVPVVELAFGASFGAYWSGLYEHYRWTFDGDHRRRAGTRTPPGRRAGRTRVGRRVGRGVRAAAADLPPAGAHASR